jgi:ribosomal protein S18 acetylase RimI-like enzyme
LTAGEPALAFRPAGDDDDEFFRRVYASTRAAELAPVPWTEEQKCAFLAQQFAAQTAHYAQFYADASFDVIKVDGEPAGRLIVARREDAIFIVDIALLPEYRSHGVGTRLLRSLIDEAGASGRNVSIHVEMNNPALTLYERLGFRPVDEHGLYLRMECDPATDRGTTTRQRTAHPG